MADGSRNRLSEICHVKGGIVVRPRILGHGVLCRGEFEPVMPRDLLEVDPQVRSP
eukprot:CAMPEP_0172566128 /NCGR_PEP_ID=MMETSP1067-20121228/110745_1 /TAXON_ID=265564 ORGANISM="Thalassiosira punctigera, Strain Tpunct2005C2" /NCGR_SAMPLE_ID=MMETSP1067 /ASSEMBLY_ACC=CAM_ASM_000444 /LENGTH=54 /DNA_ID=CAMNT_0013357165 /DNA_START=382 /DNA_END=542 /DNA_ORIENTATION=-